MVEEGCEGDDTTPDLWAIYHFSKDLDKLCHQHGVTKLSEFHDNSVMAAEFDQDIPPNFSNPQEVITSLRAVRKSVTNKSLKFESAGHDRTPDLLEELEHAIRIATDCDSRQKRIRLSVMP